MSSYGPNVDFRSTPLPQQRQGRYILDASCAQGVPLIVTDDEPSELFTKARTVELATGAQPPPLPGQGGFGIYEWIDLNGLDPVINSASDRRDMPAGKLLQVIRGEEVKVVFRNTSDHTFLRSRDYEGRIMVAGAGATPTVSEGDFLTPGVGDDASGYWAETGNEANAWLVVELVDTDRGEVEARLLF